MNQLLEQKMIRVHGDIRGGVVMSNKKNRDLQSDNFIDETFDDLESSIEEDAGLEFYEDDEVTEEVPDIAEAYTDKVSGYVNCMRLNVRKDPSVSVGNVINKLNKDDEVLIDLSNSYDIWYKISTASGIEGYCLKEFIDLKQ